MSFVEGLIESLRETPFGFFTFGIGLVALVACGVMGIIASRRRGTVARMKKSLEEKGYSSPVRFSPWIETTILVSIALVPVLTFFAIEQSRSLMLAALDPDPGSKTMFGLAAGIAGQLNGVALCSTLMLLHLPLAGIGIGLALTYRYQATTLNRLQRVGKMPLSSEWKPAVSAPAVVFTTLAFTELAISPMLVSFIRWASQNIYTFASVAGIDPLHKGAIVREGMGEAEKILDAAPMQSLVGLLVVAAIATALVFVSARKGLTEPQIDEPSGLSNKAYSGLVIGCLVGAALCFFLAMPYYKENKTNLPVDPDRIFALSTNDKIQTPNIKGPDSLGSSPVLAMSKDDVTLEYGRIDSQKGMAEKLEVQKQNYRITHPDEDGFPGELILHADREIAVEKLLPYLRTAVSTGYNKLLLGFQHFEMIDRPVLGAIRLDKSCAARINLVQTRGREIDDNTIDVDTETISAKKGLDGSKPLLLKTSKATSYNKLALVTADARKRGMKVILLLQDNEPKAE